MQLHGRVVKKKEKKKIMISDAGIFLLQMNIFKEFKDKENHKLLGTMQNYYLHFSSSFSFSSNFQVVYVDSIGK